MTKCSSVLKTLFEQVSGKIFNDDDTISAPIFAEIPSLEECESLMERISEHSFVITQENSFSKSLNLPQAQPSLALTEDGSMEKSDKGWPWIGWKFDGYSGISPNSVMEMPFIGSSIQQLDSAVDTPSTGCDSESEDKENFPNTKKKKLNGIVLKTGKEIHGAKTQPLLSKSISESFTDDLLVLDADDEGQSCGKAKYGKNDEYSPKVTRGIGYRKEARCEKCETAGTPSVWLRLKQSSYWYHMNFIHGINSQTGLPYQLPQTYRKASVHSIHPRSRLDAGNTVKEFQAKCDVCYGWIGVEAQSTDSLRHKGRVFQEISFENGKEIQGIDFFNWYRHAQKCQNVNKIISS